MSEEVDDFLMHYGIRGMKWGKRNTKAKIQSDDTQPKMSRKKKIAIGVGVGAVVAVGAAITLKSLNKNKNVPVSKLPDRLESKKGQQFTEALPKPNSRPASSSKPKAPSPYPMTPKIATPILDELLTKYNVSASDLANAGGGARIRYDSSSGRYV